MLKRKRETESKEGRKKGKKKKSYFDFVKGDEKILFHELYGPTL